MALAENIISNRYSIQAYEQGQITVNERIYSESLVLSANKIIQPWSVKAVTELKPEHFDCIFELKPDVILLGTGEKQIFPAQEIYHYFAKNGFALDVMNTGALCRTYNILVAEDRNVFAAFILSS